MPNNRNNLAVTANKRRSLRIFGGLALLVSIGLVIIWFEVVRGGDDPMAHLSTFVAVRGPLTISVPESGAIKAREREVIRNDVEGRTSIVSIVPEGTRVKAGDLLVKLDASTLDDRVIDQEILVQKAEAAYIDANENLAIVKNQAQSDIDKAVLVLEFAKQDLKKYTDPNGQYRNELVAAQNAITVADEEKTRADETLKWSARLFEEKFISQTQLQADQLSVTKSKVKLELSKNELTLLESFTYKRQIAQFTSDVNQADMALERTTRKAKANVVQAEAALSAAEQEFNRQTTKLAKIKDQLKKTIITASIDGMVVYATSSRGGGFRDDRRPLADGVEVFERQELIYLPKSASAAAEVDVHESSLQKVRVGLPAIITVDALPGKKFVGTVERIAPLPDPQSMWMNPDLKIYKTDIYLEGDDPELRSGMSCKADIIVEQYQDVVYVPVHAVLRVAGQPTVYVVKDGSIEPRKVEIGLDNYSMVRITSGLNEGEVVSLSPPLKAASVEPGSLMTGTASSDSNDTTMQRINEKLKATNGTAPGVPGAPSDNVAGSRTPAADTGLQRTGQEGMQTPSADQMQETRKRLENMSPEDRQKEMEKMKQRFESMSPEEREQMRQRFQGGASRRQSSGQGQGQDQGQQPGSNPKAGKERIDGSASPRQ
jgi:HlyD family secretion protein